MNGDGVEGWGQREANIREISENVDLNSTLLLAGILSVQFNQLTLVTQTITHSGPNSAKLTWGTRSTSIAPCAQGRVSLVEGRQSFKHCVSAPTVGEFSA